MNTWRLYLVLDKRQLTDAECDALYDAGCDDGTVVTRNGVTYIAFDREADSLEAAVDSAVAQVMNAGHVVARAEVNDGKGGQDSRRVLWTAEDLVQDELREYFSHFVALSGCYHAVDHSGKPTGDAAAAFHRSGFVLSVGAKWYWVTAGHVIDQLDKPRRESRIEIDRCVLNDSFGDPQAHDDGIPFDFQHFDPIKCHDTRLGLDFCAIELRSHYRQLLQTNHVVALSEVNWQHPDFSQLDHFFMIGLPEELGYSDITPETDGYRVRTKPQPAAVYISPVASAREESDRPVTRFVGRVDKLAGNIVGMSGGPIFGVRLGDENHYLIALQSSWLESKRLVFGCPIGEFISHLATKQQR